MEDINKIITEKILGVKDETFSPCTNIEHAIFVVERTKGHPTYQWGPFDLVDYPINGWHWEVTIYNGRTTTKIIERDLSLAISRAAMWAYRSI